MSSENPQLQIIRLGRIEYEEALKQMELLLQQRIDDLIPDTLILCEHHPVFTIGRSKDALKNLVVAGATPVVHVSRGGNITWHGPGQLVGYPIIKLYRQDIHAYLRWIEAFWIKELTQRGLSPHRDPRNTGVWVENKKMVAIGIALRKWVSWHGFAWNITANLSDFKKINPCGMSSELVTRYVDHQIDAPTIEQATEQIAEQFLGWYQEQPLSLFNFEAEL
jgi:lipoyl(octanoyl) transferase